MPKTKRIPNRLEKVIGVVLLLFLPIIGIGIYVKGQHYDPTLFSPDIYKYQQGTGENTPSLIDTNLSQVWKPMKEVEFYSPDNLYEKINGKAEQYLDYDVAGLETVTFVNKDGEGFVDLYVYDMGEPLNAFGIFSAIRYPDEPAVDLGQSGYKSSGYFFWKGIYYTQITLSDTGEDINKFALELAKDIASKQEELPAAIWGIDKFPAKDLIPNSVQYIKKKGLNLSFLNDVYTAIYQKEGNEITAFLTRKKDESEANIVFEEYRNHLSKYGTISDETKTESESIIVGDVMGYYDVIFQKGGIVGGTNAVDNRKIAEEVSQELLSGLSNP